MACTFVKKFFCFAFKTVKNVTLTTGKEKVLADTSCNSAKGTIINHLQFCSGHCRLVHYHVNNTNMTWHGKMCAHIIILTVTILQWQEALTGTFQSHTEIISVSLVTCSVRQKTLHISFERSGWRRTLTSSKNWDASVHMTQGNSITLSCVAPHLTHVRWKSSDFTVNGCDAILLGFIHTKPHHQRPSLPDKCNARTIWQPPRDWARNSSSITENDTWYDLLLSDIPDNYGKISTNADNYVYVMWAPRNGCDSLLMFRLDWMQLIFTWNSIPLQQRQPEFCATFDRYCYHTHTHTHR